MAIEIGDIFTVRCVPAGEEAWRKLLVVGCVPVPEGEPPTWAVQIPEERLETRDILASTLLNDCDLEPPL